MMNGKEYKGNGYAGISMSNNALNAYAQGKKPLSKWRKKDIVEALNHHNIDDDFIKAVSKLNLVILKEYLLHKVEYHHTGIRYNITNFYDLIDITPDKETKLLHNMQDAHKQYEKETAVK